MLTKSINSACFNSGALGAKLNSASCNTSSKLACFISLSVELELMPNFFSLKLIFKRISVLEKALKPLVKIFISKIHKNDNAIMIDEIPKNLNLFSALYLFLSKISFSLLFIFFPKFFYNV